MQCDKYIRLLEQNILIPCAVSLLDSPNLPPAIHFCSPLPTYTILCMRLWQDRERFFTRCPECFTFKLYLNTIFSYFMGLWQVVYRKFQQSTLLGTLFQMLIRNFPVAQALHIRSCRDLDTEQLRDILVQEDDFLGQGLLRVKEAYNSSVCIHEAAD